MRNTGHEGRTFRSTTSFGKLQENAGRYTINATSGRMARWRPARSLTVT
ncbi:MAG: hypothetical protein WBJ82_11565 [Tepidanaerobacteraceae bacterium]